MANLHFSIIATVPLATVHCNHNEVVIKDIKIPAFLASTEVLQIEKLSNIIAIELAKLPDKMDKICVCGNVSIQEPSEWIFSNQ